MAMNATQRLADYLQKHGPVPTVSFRPGQDKLWGLTFPYWTSARYVIQLEHGRPTLVQTGPTRYWVSHHFAQKDAETIAAKEDRILFFYPPGPVEEEACRLVLEKLAIKPRG
jgi:hypothetical protein